jgi:hypothetical protein
MNKLNSSSKYQDIYNTGKELFWKYGIKRVTIEEICKEAGVSKMTFYKFFPNKIVLAKSILESIIKDSHHRFDEILNNDSLDFSEIVKQLFVLKYEASKDISIEFINDIYKGNDPVLLEVIGNSSKRSLDMFVKFLIDSQKKGLIRKDIKIDFILYYSNHAMEMFDDKELLSKYDNPQDLIMEIMNFMFYGLMNKKC